jgi:membrane protease subunit HflK
MMDRSDEREALAGVMLNEGGPWGGGSGGSGGSSGGGGGGSGGGGDGPRNPWSQPPRKRPDGKRMSVNPPALDELLRRGRARFGGHMPDNGSRRLWAWGVIALAAVWILFTSVHQIDSQEQGVVTRLGRYAGTLRPGMRLTFPAPIDTVTKINVEQTNTIDIGSTDENENLMLTGDQNIIDLAYSVRWKVRDPELYLYEMADPEDTVREVAESAMRAEVARVTLNQAIGAQRGEIADRVAARMQELLNSYRSGVLVLGIAIKQADPPAAVNDAFKEVSAAQQDAQSYLNNARAYAQQLTAKSQGEASSFDKVYDEYRLAPEVTRRRMYYETMEDVLSKVDKTIVEAPGVTPYLPLPEIRRSVPNPPAAAASPAEPAR